MDRMREMREKMKRAFVKKEQMSFSEDEKRAMVVNICERFEYAKMNMTVGSSGDDLRELWKEIKDAFQAERSFTTPRGVKKPKARVHSPTFTTKVEKLVSMLAVRLVQPYENFITIKDRVTKIRHYPLENYMFNMFVEKKMGLEVVKAIQAAILFGVGFTKILPDNTGEMPSCNIEAVNNFDVFVDPDASTIENASFVIHRLWLTYDEVMRRVEEGRFDEDEADKMINDVKKRLETGSNEFIPDKVDSLKAQEESRTDLREVEPADDSKFDRYLIYEYYDNHNIITIGEELYFLSAQDNNVGYPFDMWYSRMPVANELWVKSHGELMLDIQHEIDIKKNQRIDNIDAAINSLTLYRRNAIDDPNDLTHNKNNKVQVNDLEGFLRWEVKDHTSMCLDEIMVLDQDADRIMSTPQVVYGVPAKKERMTRDETGAVYGQANLQFDFGSSIMVTTGFIPMLQKIMLFTGKTFTGGMPMASSRENGLDEPVEIDPLAFARNWEISVDINPTREMLDRQKAVEMYQLFSQNAYINQVSLLRYIMPKLDPDYPRDMITDGPEMQAHPENVQLSNNA